MNEPGTVHKREDELNPDQALISCRLDQDLTQ